MKKRVAFMLPGARRSASGGYKVVYEYANKLAEDGYDVDIVYPCSMLNRDKQLWEKVRRLLRLAYLTFSDSYNPRHWFALDSRVKLHYVWTFKERYMPHADIYFATAVQTSPYLNEFRRISPANKYYLIQGYETWHWPEQRVHDTYRYDMQKIVIAPWLKEKVEQAGAKATLIHNGFNFDYFKMSVAPEDKDKYCVSMLYHRSPLKGCADGMAALEIVRERFPQLHVRMFGATPLPESMQRDWVEFVQMPDRESHNAIYNNSAIYLAPSHSEGFALTPPEAMMCGCAVVCTDIGGYRVVCHHEQTALLAQMGDAEALAQSMIRLIENDQLRIRIAHAGHKAIQDYTWDNAYAKLRELISGKK